MTTLAEVIRTAINASRLEQHTCLLGKVAKSYSGVRPTVDVELVTNSVLNGDNGALVSEKLPVLPGVPVAVMGPFTFPLMKGDPCIVLFSESDFNGWLRTGLVSDPDDLRRFNLAHAICLPMGLINDTESSEPSAEDAVVVSGDDIRLGTHVEADLDNVALYDGLKTLADAINSWTATPQDGGAALKVALTNWLVDTLGDTYASTIRASKP